MEGHINQGNSLFIRHNASHTTVWFTPTMVDFDERVHVRINGRQEFNDYIAPDPGALLEALRVSGDRERPVWARLEF